MTAQLATSIFSKGPKDVFAAVDGYIADGKEVLNSIPVNLKDASDIFKAVKFTNQGFDLLGTATALNKTVIGDYLKIGADGLGLKIHDLKGGILDKATTLLEKTAPGAQAMMCSIGDYTSSVEFKDIARAAKLGYAVSQANGIDGIVRVVNQSQNSALFSSMIGEASSLGISGVMTSLKNTIDKNGLMTRVVKGALPFVLSNSDSSLLRELSSGSMGVVMNTLSPGFARSFSSVFNPQYKYNFNNVSSFNSIIDSFDDINRNWDKATQGGASITSIFSILSGTKGFKTLLGSGVAYVLKEVQDEQKKKRAQDLVLARIYAESTVREQLTRYFPGLIINGDYSRKTMKAQTTDIRLIGRSINAFLS